MSWLAEVLACPACHGKLENEGGESLCSSCGVVAHRTLGYTDFLRHVDALPVAAGQTLNLRDDEEIASDLEQRYEKENFQGLTRLATEMRVRRMEATRQTSAQVARLRRHLSGIRELNVETMGIGANAFLTKIENKLAELRWPPLRTHLGLEAGGGEGLYLMAFARRFDRVVFVDASLTNVLLAAKACEEQGSDNVGFVRADAMSLPLKSTSFDFVHENNLIEHVQSPRQMVAEALRVRHERGYYVCVSPNRLSALPEPHFGLPGYGFIPRPVRHALIPLRRGFTYEEAGTDPLSLGQFSQCIGAPRQDAAIFFLPRNLPFTARTTRIRTTVRHALGTPWIGAGADFLMNRLLLGIMPQHIAIVRKA